MSTERDERKYLRIEDLPGVGSSTAEKLRELGFHTVESLAMATGAYPSWYRGEESFSDN